MKNNQKGFGAVEGLLILVIVGLIGFVGWYVYHSKNSTDNTLDSAADTTIATTAKQKNAVPTVPKAAQTQQLEVTPYLGQKLELSTPTGWTKVAGDDGKLQKTIDGTNYIVDFQITEQDYLKLPAYSTNPGQVLGSTTSLKGTKIYIIKISDMSNIALSSCAPRGTKACSLTQDGKPLFVMVLTPAKGAPGPIDFSSSSINTLVGDIESIASSIPL